MSRSLFFDHFYRSEIDINTIELSRKSASLDNTAVQILEAMKQHKNFLDTACSSQATILNSNLGELNAILQQTSNARKKSPVSGGEIQKPSQESHPADGDKDYQYRVNYDAVPAIIESLAFQGMNDRFERVIEAHAKTFSWIFDPDTKDNIPWDSFLSWLQSGDGIYWINGKAASGKSTLMRYIFEHSATFEHLKSWAGEKQIILSKFYFWSTGSVVQKSQIGLFRTLMHQMFNADPTLVPKILPTLVHDIASLPPTESTGLRHRTSTRTWSLSELKDLFWAAIKNTTPSRKFCFFIDGLDEFDGNYLELVTFLKEVSTRPNSKLCLSSRPLLAFEQQLDGFPKLRLQDLTVQDITIYVQDNLSSHPRFATFTCEVAEETQGLVDEIVLMSSGVFLWVSLVVKSLLNGLTNYDTLFDLRQRLRELPDELDGLYSHMLNSIKPPFYLEQASRLFQLVYQSSPPISLIKLSFADDDDLTLTSESTPASICKCELNKRTRAMKRRLKSRCAGLLEVDNAYHESPREWYKLFSYLILR